MQLLLIEDDSEYADYLRHELEQEGFDVTVADNGREGLALAAQQSWDLILLDLIMPGLNGIEICRRLRNRLDRTPIMIVTSRSSVIDRVSGLDSGADDYVLKPVEIEELFARIRALLRRTGRSDADSADTSMDVQDLHIDLLSRQVARGGETVELTKREYDLLVVLLQNKNTVMTRKQLLDKVWGYSTGTETNLVDVYIRYLRQKISGEHIEKYVQTVRGVGYIIKD